MSIKNFFVIFIALFDLLLMYVKKDCKFEKGEGAEREVITNG